LKKEEDRWSNIIVAGTIPGDGGSDNELVRNIADDVGVSLSGVMVSTKRIGKVAEDGKQRLLVTVTKGKRAELLRNARQLRGVDGRAEVFLHPDLSKKDQLAQFLLREERRKKTREEPSKK
jgi:hypothetical protein